jgi:hypothetical protein
LALEHRAIVATFSRTSTLDTDEPPETEEGVVLGYVGTTPWVLIAGQLRPFAPFTQDAPERGAGAFAYTPLRLSLR